MHILSLKIQNCTSENKKFVISRLIKKYILYFIFLYILLFFFWYYASCFCAVYKNNQIHLIKNTLIAYSFLYFIYPFITRIIPGIIRISALSSQNSEHECLYKFSQFLAGDGSYQLSELRSKKD